MVQIHQSFEKKKREKRGNSHDLIPVTTSRQTGTIMGQKFNLIHIIL